MSKNSFLLGILSLIFYADFAEAHLVPMGFWRSRGPIQRGTASTAVQSTASSIVLTKPANTQLNDVIYAFIWVDYYGALGTVTTPAGWTQLGFTALSNQYALYVLRRVSDGTDGASYTFSFSAPADYSMGSVIAYTNVDVNTPEDAAVTFSQGIVASSTVSVTGVTTVSNFALVLTAFVDTSRADSLGAPAGYTQKWLNIDSTNSQTIAGYDQVFISPVATGSISTTGWNTTSNKYQAAVLAIRSK